MAAELTGGWVKLWRSIGDSDLWLMEPFTKAQAWIDLILHANHKPGYINIRGAMIQIDRGQIGWSELTMSKRWRWSREKVRRFLKHLSDASQIVQQTGHLTSVITICNYDKYQSNDTTDETTSRAPNKTTDETQTRREEGKEGRSKRDSYESLPANFQSSEYRDESIRFSEWWATELRPGSIKDNMTNRVKWAHVWFHLRETDGRANGGEMSEAISWARSEPFWSTNFLSPMKLREKDKNGVMYIDRFLEQYRKQKDGGLSNGKQQRGLTAGKLGKLADLINSGYSSIPA